MVTATHLTYHDLESIPQEREGDRHELIDGELVVTPSPIPRHQIVSGNIVFALQSHVRENDLGLVLGAPTDVRLTPDNVLVPDILFISRERLHVVGPKAIDAPPDLVVEILSPGTRQRDLATKRALYARFGVQEYWNINPELRSVTVLGRVGDQYVEIQPNDDATLRSLVLPDLSLTFEAVFKGV